MACGVHRRLFVVLMLGPASLVVQIYISAAPFFKHEVAGDCAQNPSQESGIRDRSIFELECIFKLLYTVPKISSISYPYQCLFVPSAQKRMGREKIISSIDSNGNFKLL